MSVICANGVVPSGTFTTRLYAIYSPATTSVLSFPDPLMPVPNTAFENSGEATTKSLESLALPPSSAD